MTTTTRRPSPRPRHAAPDEELVVEDAPKTCNVCAAAPEWRGLCAAHRQTHRGLADPKEPR